MWLCDWQVPGDPPNGGGPQQHRQVSEADGRPRPVPNLPDPQGVKGQLRTSDPWEHGITNCSLKKLFQWLRVVSLDKRPFNI